MNLDKLLDFVAPSVSEDVSVASCRRSEVELLAQKWEGYMFGFLLGKRPHLPSLKSFLLAKWNLVGSLDLSIQSEGAFLLQFRSVDGKIRVLESGPWFVGGRLLVLKPWRERLRRSDFNLSSVPIWICFPNLLLEFWSKDYLSRIGSLFGNRLFCDEYTTSQSRNNFARICVEVGASSLISNKILIDVEGSDRFEQEVAMEWRPPSCSFCKCFSHNDKNCKLKIGFQDQYFEDCLGLSCIPQAFGETLAVKNSGQPVSVAGKKRADIDFEIFPGWSEVRRKKNQWRMKGKQVVSKKDVQDRGILLDESVLDKFGCLPEVAELARDGGGRVCRLEKVLEVPQAVSFRAAKPLKEIRSNLNEEIVENLEVCPDNDSSLSCTNKDINLGGETVSATAEKDSSKSTLVDALGVVKETEDTGWQVGLTTFSRDSEGNNACTREQVGLLNTVGEYWKSNGFRPSIECQDFFREIVEESSVESIPPGFSDGCSNNSKVKSMETTIHVIEEHSKSEEEKSYFSSGHVRMIREKLGIRIVGTENVDRAFANFCRSRQMEIESNRKKLVVSDVSMKLMKLVGKKGISLKRDSGRRRKH